MKILGVTGPSGAGKSLFCSYLAQCGVPWIDADAVARQVVEKGKPCLAELRHSFGNDILREDGSLDRGCLAARAFSSPKQTAMLNRITHRYIECEIRKWLAQRAADGEALCAVDAPQLFESGLDKACDAVVGVLADRSARFERVAQRDGLAQEEIRRRFSAARPDGFFLSHCDHIIYNNGDEKQLSEQAKRLVELLIGKGVPAD